MADEMTTSPPPAPTPPSGTPPGTPARRPRGAIVAILLIGGPIIAVGGCAMFLSKINSSTTDMTAALGGIMFVGGAGMFLLGCLFALVLVIQFIYAHYGKKD